jgi:hypothetical protein
MNQEDAIGQLLTCGGWRKVIVCGFSVGGMHIFGRREQRAEGLCEG